MMTKLKRKVRKVEIELPKGKIIIMIPICEPVDTSDIKRIEKQQRSVEIGTCNGIPSTISMTSISGELVQSYSTTEEFLVYFDLISRRVILKAKNLLARTINKDGELVDSKIVSKTICPLNSYFLCRFNVLSLNPNNPNNGPMHINQLWISDPVITSNTKNIDDIMVLGNMGISIVSPEKGFVLFTEVFQAGMKLRKNVSTLMITTTERITDYIFNAIDVPLS